MREYPRGLPVFAGVLADFDTDRVPAEPVSLFIDWLRAAVDAGVREPQAMTLSTSGPDGPGARVLILKDVDARGWWFATSAASAKGRRLASESRAARAADVQLANDPTLVDEAWTAYAVRLETVEFWPADKDRLHHRLSYQAQGDDWQRTLLWP